MSRTRIGVATGVAAAVFMYRRLFVPWQQRWGATDEEVDASLPGDDLVPEASSQITRAISIEASVDTVWQWLVQIGAERGGFYSYDWLEDLFALGIHSTETLVPEWQNRSVGDVVFGDAKKRGGWYVMEAVPDRALVLQTGDLKYGRPATCENGAPMEFTWAFVLRQATDGTTRLLVRERVAFRNRPAALLLSPLGTVSFVMTQKMMRGIKERAESLAIASDEQVEARVG